MRLTLSETWLTTQTSVALRAAATGSRPTGTEGTVLQTMRVDVEDLEPIVGRVGGKQPLPVRRQGQGTDLATLEEGER